MTEIVVMSYGHELWNETIKFAEKCSWRAGQYLAQKMKINDFADNERVLAAVEGGRIVAFCTFSNKDELPDEYDFTPFVGFVFVDEQYRGHRISERLIGKACDLARQQRHSKMYIMSGENGLYEKYGFVKIGEYKTIYDSVDQLFYKEL